MIFSFDYPWYLYQLESIFLPEITLKVENLSRFTTLNDDARHNKQTHIYFVEPMIYLIFIAQLRH